MSGPIYNFVKFFFATLYPAYYSFKAVKTKNVREYVKWMMYWIIYAFFTALETLVDPFLYFWLPFYTEVKVVLLLYLVAPATRGSGVIYRRWVHPLLCDKEEEIDAMLGRAREQGYKTALSWVHRSIQWLAGAVMTTAIKGGGGLVQHLKRSYSLTDLSEVNQTSQSRFTDITEQEGIYSPYSTPRLGRKQYQSQDNLNVYPIEQRRGFRSNQLMSQLPSMMLSNESISSGYNTDFHPVAGDTMETEDYELWERRTQVHARQTTPEKKGQVKSGLNRKLETDDKDRQKATKNRVITRSRAKLLESSLSDDEDDKFYESLQTPFGQKKSPDRQSSTRSVGQPFTGRILMSPDSSCYPSDMESVRETDDSGSETDCDEIFSEAPELGDTHHSGDGDNTPTAIDFGKWELHTKELKRQLTDLQENEKTPQLPPRRSAKKEQLASGLTKETGSPFSSIWNFTRKY